jgi:hypothetical protein
MIRFVTLAESLALDLPDADLSLEIASPYFDAEAIPGTTSAPFDLAWTRTNLRALGFPHLFRGSGGPPPVEVDCYLDGVCWRRGRLVFRGGDPVARRLRYTFVADAADLATQLKDVRLATLPLPLVPLERVPRTATYALLPVRNSLFFGDNSDTIPAEYHGVLNYYAAGQYPAGALLAPQPYLVPLLRAVMAAFGYTVTGSWVEDAEIQRLVLYSDRVLAAGATTVDLRLHVPDMTVPDLLIGLQQYFCLGMSFDTVRQELRITPLRDILAARAQYQPRTGQCQSTEANTTTGFDLRLVPGDDDELDKTLDTSWQRVVVGKGGEKIEVAAGTLHLVREADSQVAGRQWLLPAIEATGASPEADTGDESKVGLRLLFDRGLQPDSQGNLYPLGSALNRNFDNTRVGDYALQWTAGDAGLLCWHQAWLEFRGRAVQYVYETEFRIADLLTLDPATAELLDYHLHLWEKVSLSVSTRQPLTRATVTYQELL